MPEEKRAHSGTEESMLFTPDSRHAFFEPKLRVSLVKSELLIIFTDSNLEKVVNSVETLPGNNWGGTVRKFPFCV